MNPDNRLTPETKADIQGFITSAFGHLPFTAYLFLEIGDRAPGAAVVEGYAPFPHHGCFLAAAAGCPQIKTGARPQSRLHL